MSANGFAQYTIENIFKRINTEFFLPDIQREFVWDEQRVIDFFDSLLKEYPIGTFLIWKQKVEKYNNCNRAYQVYRFIKEVHATDNSGELLRAPYHTNKKNYHAVLDGQQRLTAIYLALVGEGGFKMWKGRGRHRDGDVPPLRELYFSPAGRSGKNNPTENKFSFFDTASVPKSETWIKVKDLFAAKNVDKFCKDRGIVDKPRKTQINNLFEVLKKKKILPIYEISEETDAVDVFVRMNSRGVPLKRTDLLFAFAINSWSGGRSQMESYLKALHSNPKTYGDWKSIDKDFILKTCLFLFESQISMTVKDLRSVDFGQISNNWDSITESTSDVLKFLDEYGHSSSTIKSSNAIIPIIYYRYNSKKYFRRENVKKELNAYFVVSQVGGLFERSTDRVLLAIKESLNGLLGRDFSLGELSVALEENDKNEYAKCLQCNKEIINSWILGDEAFKKGEDARLLLSALPEYRDRGNYYFEQDHLHPTKTFDNPEEYLQSVDNTVIEEWKGKKDYIGNLQLYRDRNNKKKSGTPLLEWKESHPGFKFAYDPAEKIKKDPKFAEDDNPYDIKYFDLFVKFRSEMIVEALTDLLLPQQNAQPKKTRRKKNLASNNS